MPHPPPDATTKSPALAGPQPQVLLLGPPRLTPAGSTTPQPLSRMDAALLALVVLRSPLERDLAARWLWPEADVQLGRNALRQRLYRLKLAAGTPIVTAGTATLRLADGVSHDLAPLLNPEAPWAADAHVDLLGGLDYSDCGELSDWLRGARGRWHSARRDRLAREVDTLEAQGRWDDALLRAEQQVADHPSSEQAHRNVMRLHYLRGDRAAGLAAFESCRKALKREVNAEPGPKTLELLALVRNAQVQPALAGGREVVPPAVLRPPRLVGRQAEWRLLEQAWPHKNLVVISGEPGIGKSRLAGEFAQAHGWLPAFRIVPSDALVPYSMLARLLGLLIEHAPPAPDWATGELVHLVPSLGSAPAHKLVPLRLRLALDHVLVAACAAGLEGLVLEDLQFSDGASLEMLLGCLHTPESAHPAASQQPRRPRLLVTLRSNEKPPFWNDWLASLPPGFAADVALGPLNRAAVRELLDSLGEVGLDFSASAETLLRRTGGNPLFILESLLAERQGADKPEPGGATPPHRLAKLIERRLQQLPSTALSLARLAALAGPDFSVPLATAVMRVHELELVTDWQALETAQVLSRGGFAYDLVAETVAASIPMPIARVLHRGIAQGLAGAGAPPGRLAHHWFVAEQWEQAAVAFEAAAAQARRASRHAEELAFLDQAALCHVRADHPAHAFKARERAIEPATTVEGPSAVDQRIQDLLNSALTPVERLDALLAQSKQLLNCARWTHALPPTEAALALAQPLGDDRRLVRAVAWRGMALVMVGEATAGQGLFAAHALQARGLHDTPARLDFFGAWGYALFGGARFQEALEPLQRAAALAHEVGDLKECLVQTVNLSICSSMLGDRAGALAQGEEAMSLWRRLGEPEGVESAMSHMQVASHFIGAGHYREALSSLDWALAQFANGKAEILSMMAEFRLARLYVRLGQPARARQALTPLPASAGAGSRLARLVLECRLDPRGARDRLAEATANLSSEIQAADRFGALLYLASLERPAKSLALCDTLCQQAKAGDDRPALVNATIRRADALRRLGRGHEAAEEALRSLALFTSAAPLDMEPPEFWWLAVQALQAGGREEAASHALAQALAWIAATELQVPEGFLHSFRHRNPFVHGLLAAGSSVVRG